MFTLRTKQEKLLAAGLGTIVLVLVIVSFATNAASSFVWNQGFETDTARWRDASNGQNGTITRVASDTNGITSSAGSYHAIVEGDGQHGPLSEFDTFRNRWPGGHRVETDVYLDPAWVTGEGFDFVVASNGTDGNLQREFAFHVGTVNDANTGSTSLLVNASANTDAASTETMLKQANNGDYYKVTEPGWYTLQHIFRDAGGILTVDMNLLKDQTIVWGATVSNPADTIPAEVGGNRYAWFKYLDVTGGVAIDEHSLELPLPSPTSRQDCEDYDRYGFKNRGHCNQFVNKGTDKR